MDRREPGPSTLLKKKILLVIFFLFLELGLPLRKPLASTFPISLTQLIPTQPKNLTKTKILKKKFKNFNQPNNRVLASGVLNAKYLAFITPNTKNTTIPNVLNAILK